MSCNRLRKRLELYAGGDLSGRDAAEVELHLRACLSCYREYVSRRDLLELVRSTGGTSPRGDAEVEGLVAGVMRRIDGLPPAAPRLLPRLALASGWAAALLVAVFFGLDAWRAATPRGSSETGPAGREALGVVGKQARTTNPFDDEAWVQSQLDLLNGPSRTPKGVKPSVVRTPSRRVRDF